MLGFSLKDEKTSSVGETDFLNLKDRVANMEIFLSSHLGDQIKMEGIQSKIDLLEKALNALDGRLKTTEKTFNQTLHNYKVSADTTVKELSDLIKDSMAQSTEVGRSTDRVVQTLSKIVETLTSTKESAQEALDTERNMTRQALARVEHALNALTKREDAAENGSIRVTQALSKIHESLKVLPELLEVLDFEEVAQEVAVDLSPTLSETKEDPKPKKKTSSKKSAKRKV